MRVFVIDTEYLTWNNLGSKKNPLKRKKNEPPEIIQIFIKEIFTKRKKEKLFFVKPVNYQIYPHRISKLTSIKKKFLDRNGSSFKSVYNNLNKFLPKNSLIISNGDESKIIDINLKINKVKKLGKKLFFLNFYILIKNLRIFKKYKKKKFITNNQIKKTFKIKNIKSHDAKNDVLILIKSLKIIGIEKKGIKENF